MAMHHAGRFSQPEAVGAGNATGLTVSNAGAGGVGIRRPFQSTVRCTPAVAPHSEPSCQIDWP
jgi:hypothetical protein